MKQKSFDTRTRSGRRKYQQQLAHDRGHPVHQQHEKSRNTKVIAGIIAFIVFILLVLLLVPYLLNS